MGDEFVDLVLSDVHVGADNDDYTVFTIHDIDPKSSKVCVDEDGDLDPPRKVQKNERSRRKDRDESIYITHKSATPLKDVGFQVWRGSLVLADYLVHHERDSSLKSLSFFHSSFAMEIGCGVGLCGLVLSRVAKRVFLTDYTDDILDNCEANVKRNRSQFHYPDCAKVRLFDWFDKSSLPVEGGINKSVRYKWSEEDMEELKEVKVIIASDVIYDDDLTDALFDMLSVLLQGDKVLFMSLEKRLNFTVDEMEITSHSYDHFHSYLSIDDPRADWGPYEVLFNNNNNNDTNSNNANNNSLSSSPSPLPSSSASSSSFSSSSSSPTNNTANNTPNNTTNNTINNTTNNTTNNTPNTTNTTNNNINENNNNSNNNTNKTTNMRPIFHAQPIPIDFPQYFNYERVKELELWIIKLGHTH